MFRQPWGIITAMRQSQIATIRVVPLSIPLRHAFRHAAHVRDRADPLIIQVELADGTLGHGETLPRPYVSGETADSVVAAVKGPLLAELLPLKPSSFAEALERIDSLPMFDDQGRVIAAARAGVELALLDVYSRHFRRRINDAVGWMGLAWLGAPGSARHVRYSAVLSGGRTDRLKRSVRMMRLYGLRDFKLKVGYDDDLDRVNAVVRALGRALSRKSTLRLDANGAWKLDRAIRLCKAFEGLPVSCIEQPFQRGREEQLVRLKNECKLTVMHDESLVTQPDAERLHRMGIADAFNIRISKNGGFLPSLRLAHWAAKRGIRYQLGCMVGETSLLSAVGRRFLENVPGVWFAEGSYGRFLLDGDITRSRVQFRYGGRYRPLTGPGWGVEVDQALLRRYAAGPIVQVNI